MKTKQEIAQKIVSEYIGSVMGMYEKMMEEYAKQEAIAFAEFIDKHSDGVSLLDAEINLNVNSTEEIYKEFLQSKSQKEEA